MLAGPGLRAQEIANLAWSLAVMGDYAEDSFLSDLVGSAAQKGKNGFSVVESHQLYQVRCLM